MNLDDRILNALDLLSPETQRQIRWRCGHGGMLELDLVFTQFFDARFATLSLAQQQDFVALLNLPDAQLFAWLMAVESPDLQFREIIESIRQFNVAADFTHL